MKKFLFPLLTGVLLLSACTTPVSKLETVEQQGPGGYDSAWETEQHGYDEDPYAKYYQEGVPIFSELQTQVLRPSPIFGDLDTREDLDDFSMGISGFFRSTTVTDENGEQEVTNESTSMSGTAEEAGAYRVEFGCWGVGRAAVQVFINVDFPEIGMEPTFEMPMTCNVPAATTYGEFEIDRSTESYYIVVSGDPETIGSYELNLYRSDGR